MQKSILAINKEVSDAINNQKPVIALESTIISHGLPYPENIEIAEELENLARSLGVTPATICLYNGKIHVGITSDILEILATSRDVEKVTRRNLTKVLHEKKTGATTVAGTMIAAHLAGIKVFATGGIGGVHREAETTFDISADLGEFTRTPIIVVSAGAKAILDLPKTLEFLETAGVPVYGFQTNDFPAFYSRKSGLTIDTVNSVEDVVDMFKISHKLGITNGMLVANPIPPQYEIPHEIMETYIQQALNEAKEHGVTGPNVTPFLLKKIVDLTERRSLDANLHLVRNNVKLGCEIAKELNENGF